MASSANLVPFLFLVIALWTSLSPASVAHAQASPSPPPTQAQLRAELARMKRQMSANAPVWNKYSLFLKSIGEALNASYPVPQLSSATLLVPTNAAVTKMLSKVKPTDANKARLTSIAQFHVITRRLTYSQLLALPGGARGALPTLQGAKAQRYVIGSASAGVFIGRQGLLRFQVAMGAARIVDKSLYQGPYFTVQGVDKMMQTTWYSG